MKRKNERADDAISKLLKLIAPNQSSETDKCQASCDLSKVTLVHVQDSEMLTYRFHFNAIKNICDAKICTTNEVQCLLEDIKTRLEERQEHVSTNNKKKKARKNEKLAHQEKKITSFFSKK